VKFSRPRPAEGPINLTPLIDMVFILLVFFMLAGSIRPTALFTVTLPTSASRTFGDERDLVLLIRADGELALNNERMTLPDATARIADSLRTDPSGLVQVKADGDADANEVIATMEALREAGVGYIVLLTRGAGLGDEA